ncbi:MAG: phasin family protein [Bacillota bacterium]
MLDLIISLGWGTFSITREKAEKLVDMLITKGEISREEAKNTINVLLARGEKEREEVRQYFKREVNGILQKCNFATRDDFMALQERVKALEAKVSGSSDEDAKSG